VGKSWEEKWRVLLRGKKSERAPPSEEPRKKERVLYLILISPGAVAGREEKGFS